MFTELITRSHLSLWVALVGLATSCLQEKAFTQTAGTISTRQTEATASIHSKDSFGPSVAPQGNDPGRLPADSNEGAELKGLIDDALASALALKQEHPGSNTPLVILAAMYDWLGLTAPSEEHWKICLERDPNNISTIMGLAKVKFHQGQDSEVLALYRRARSIETDSAVIPVFMGLVLVRLGHFGEAVAILEPHALTHPDLADCHLWLGQCYLQLKQYEKARDSYEKVRDLAPTLRGAWYGLARVYLRLGLKDEAEACRKQFAKLRSKSLDAIGHRLQAYDDRDGVQAFVIDVHTSIGAFYRAESDHRRAEASWKKVIAIDPQETACHLQLADLYESTKRKAEAMRMYQALARNEQGNPLHHLYAGVMSAEVGQLASAEAAYRKVIELAPKRVEGYEALLGILLRIGAKPDEARTLAQRLVEQAPSGHTYALLAQASHALGDRNAALDALRQAIRLDPQNTRYRQSYLTLLEGK